MNLKQFTTQRRRKEAATSSKCCRARVLGSCPGNPLSLHSRNIQAFPLTNIPDPVYEEWGQAYWGREPIPKEFPVECVLTCVAQGVPNI